VTAPLSPRRLDVRLGAPLNSSAKKDYANRMIASTKPTAAVAAAPLSHSCTNMV
jgi:hypothetical protein